MQEFKGDQMIFSSHVPIKTNVTTSEQYFLCRRFFKEVIIELKEKTKRKPFVLSNESIKSDIKKKKWKIERKHFTRMDADTNSAFKEWRQHYRIGDLF